MNIAICEDNATEAAQIRGLLLEHFERNCFAGDIHVFHSGEALTNAFQAGSFDMIFLDIYMDGMTGMEAAHKIRQADPSCAIAFITVSREHALEAFSVRANAYVPKPITCESIDAAFEQCRDVFIKNARYIEVTSDRQSIKIPLVKIEYVEMDGRSTLFHTANGVIKTYLPLDDVERQLGVPFLRCHRAFIVNMNHIDKIREQDILMRSGAQAPLRKNGGKDVRSAYGEFTARRLFE